MRTFFLYIGLVIILFFLLTITSASEEHNSLHEKLKADWVSESFEDWMHETVFLLSFRDKKCLFLTPSQSLKNYRLIKDTLIVTDITQRSSWDTRRPIIHSYYKILSLTEDKLLLKVILDTTRSSLKYYYEAKKTDTIAFQKIVKKNNIAFERIAFFSNFSDCENCPDLYLELDNLGNIKFNGKSGTPNKGFFESNVPLNILNKLYKKIHAVDTNTLGNEYRANWTDDQTCGILIQTKDTTYNTLVYGFDKEPPEIRFLINYLTFLYNDVDLKENLSIENNFTFQNYHDEAFPQWSAPIPTEEIGYEADYADYKYMDTVDKRSDSTFAETSRRAYFKLLGIPYFSEAEVEIKLAPNCPDWSFEDSTILYPILRGSEIKERINENLNNELKSDFEFDSNLSITATLEKMKDDCLVYLAYQLYIDSNYISVKLDFEWADPFSYSFSKYFTFSLENGIRIELLDLVEKKEEFLLYIKSKQIEHLNKYQSIIKLEYEKGDLDIYDYKTAIELTNDFCFIESWESNFIIKNDVLEIDINCGFPRLTEAFAPYNNLIIKLEELDRFK
ncbi:MAG: hypothetical protein KDC55_09495 [Ignavibacteriae bacterium]|nr:hypothetical protein [Ignavibacteriota bacterium]